MAALLPSVILIALRKRSHDWEGCVPATAHIFVGIPTRRSVSECNPSPSSEQTLSQRLELLDQRAAIVYHDEVFSYAPGLMRMPLPDGHELIFSPLYGSYILVLDQVGQHVLNYFAEPQTPASIVRLAEDVQDAYQIAIRLAAHGVIISASTPPAQPTSPDTLSVWLHVTNACNLACSYCYVAKSAEAMDAATGLRAIDTIFATARRYGYRKILLKYAGGESTLNFALIEQLHRYAIARATVEGIVLEEVLLSNGVAVTPTMLTYLRDTKIQLLISIDGPPHVQDRQRPRPNGRGSFASVIETIDSAVAIGIRPHLAIVVTPVSAQYVAETVHIALDRDLRFSLSFERQHTVVGNDFTTCHSAIIKGIQSAFEEIAAIMPNQRLVDSLVDRAGFDLASQQVCGAGDSLLVIDHKGRIARCQTDLAHPVSQISESDPLLSIRLEPTGFQRTPTSAKEGCRKCAWQYWCAGGCPALTYQMTGRNDVQSPYCNVYKQLYPEAIRLEGLRLLKVASNGTQAGIEVWV